MDPVYIQALASVSALGHTRAEAEYLYAAPKAPFSLYEEQPVFRISPSAQEELDGLLSIHPWLSKQSRTVQLAVLAASMLPRTGDTKTLVNIGSSRGSTDAWEKHYAYSLLYDRISPGASPSTTPGNISASVGRYLHSTGMVLDHSVTCGSGLQALANGIAWIGAGMAEQVIAGGSEAPLTPFTMNQFRSLGILSAQNADFPSKPLGLPADKSNTLCLGEAASVALLSAQYSPYRIIGIGFGSEQASSPSGITHNGEALQQSMKQALRQAILEKPDAIIAHAPGTRRGDAAEQNAIQILTGNDVPVFSTKHLTGHTLGASGMLSLQLAMLLLDGAQAPLAYEAMFTQANNGWFRNVLINATGFGGNAISLVIEKC